MQKVISTYLFNGQRLTSDLLADIARAGIPAVEIFCAQAHFDYHEPTSVRELGEWLERHRLELHSVHSPTSRDFSPGRESGAPLSIAETERVRRLDAVDEVKRALDVAEQVPYRFLVQHLGSSREPLDARRLDAAFNSLEHLVIFAKQRGVTIALENTPGELTNPAALRHFIQDTRLHDLRLCFDSGHANLEDGVGRSFEAMRDLVVTTHLHDNHGEKDEHLLPYEGTIDWEATLQTLAAAPRELPVVLELKEPAPAAMHTISLERVAATLDQLENAMAVKRASAARS